MEMQHIIYMPEASGQPTSIIIGPSCTAYILLMIDCECQQKLNAKYICYW